MHVTLSPELESSQNLLSLKRSKSAAALTLADQPSARLETGFS